MTRSAPRAPFGTRLAAAVASRGRLCVGLDPHPALLSQWGLGDDVASLERFCRTVVQALGERVAVVKPQSALFERFGSRGIAVLERVLADLRDTGALSVLDAKRGDIGSTMAGYAEAYLQDGSPLAADALTVNPYLGLDTLAPAVEVARAHGRGLYVLARTSNPDSGWLQLAEADGRSVAQRVVDSVTELNASTDLGADQPAPVGPAGSRRWAPGPFGVVVGGTHGQASLDLSRFNGSVLVPGLGAQGATVADLAASFDRPHQLLPSSSRSILAAGPEPAGLQAAVAQLQTELALLDPA